ncbi:MAG: hypothetical protein HOI66_01480 [Verrucomicrobia bacterium]|nr:hypothetical protein [Verrucomicrobiota bacterium]
MRLQLKPAERELVTVASSSVSRLNDSTKTDFASAVDEVGESGESVSLLGRTPKSSRIVIAVDWPYDVR